MRKYIVSRTGVIVIAMMIFIVSCVPGNPDRVDCRIQKGVVTEILPHEGTGDITFHLKDADGSFYINRGVQQKLPTEEWRQKLMGEEITIAYYKGTTHICEVRFADSVLYSEFN